jgi:hypothetical protein
MTIPIGPLRLTITLSLATGAARTWEALAAIGMNDQELALLNVRNTHTPESAMWEQRHHLLVSGPWP